MTDREDAIIQGAEISKMIQVINRQLVSGSLNVAEISLNIMIDWANKLHRLVEKMNSEECRRLADIEMAKGPVIEKPL